MRQLKGIHHVTAITSSAEKIYAFFTYVLGLRLVKKTINQDDIHTYHLFFADDKGSPGTDMTFFDFPGSMKGEAGTDQISRTGFRVPSDEALAYWKKRFASKGVEHENIKVLFDRHVLFFSDFDGQRYALFSDEGVPGIAPGIAWEKGPIPNQYAIYGLGPIFISVSEPEYMNEILTKQLGLRFVAKEENQRLYEMGEGGNGASVIIIEDQTTPRGMQGYGSVHHVAFRIEDKEELDEWTRHFNRIGAPNSGYVDRFYFKSLYTRLYRPVLFELATEGPGFIDDEEPYETLGEILALPPRFRNMRERIEKLVRPIDTKRSHLTIEKEL